MLQEIEMTVNEQITMYMKCSKKELCKMLIEANRHLKNLPIHVVNSTLLSPDYLIELHPNLDYKQAIDLLRFCMEHTITHKECYGKGQIMYPKWLERK